MLWMFLQAIINGLLAGGVYALVAVGITLVYGIMKMVNFAMGDFLTWGMYATYVGYLIFGWDCYALIPFVIICMIVLGWISFGLCVKPLLGRDTTTFIMMTLGLSYFLMNFAQLIFTANSLTVPSSIKSASVPVGPFYVGMPRLIACGVAFLLVLGVNFLLNKSYVGRAMRATAENAEVATMLGVSTTKYFRLAFILSVVLAGLAGLLLTPIYFVSPSAGTILKTTALMIVVLGGMGSIKGAFIGGLLVGVVEQVCATIIDAQLGQAGIFVLFLLVLYLKPQGLFGKGARIA